MKVLITGAGGNLGRVLAPALQENGYEPILMDNREIDTRFRFIRGDLTNQEDVFRAAQEADIIVHAAALHGIHLGNHSRDKYMQLNVLGTYHIYEAALKFGIRKVLLCSTNGIYGESLQAPENGVAVITEETPVLPSDFYGLSKQLCENMAQMYARAHGIQTISYRIGMFVPTTFIDYGFRLLKGGVDDRDVAQAFLLGIANNFIIFDAFDILAENPLSEIQFTEMKINALDVMERRFPGFLNSMSQLGVNAGELLQQWGFMYWPIDKARKVLGYQPKHNFTEFYEALKNGDEGYYPYANLPWWGV